MNVSVLAHITLVYDCPVSPQAGSTDQKSQIEDDVSRLLDGGSTTDVACTGVTVTGVEPVAGSKPDSRTHIICATCGSENVRADAYAS